MAEDRVVLGLLTLQLHAPPLLKASPPSFLSFTLFVIFSPHMFFSTLGMNKGSKKNEWMMVCTYFGVGSLPCSLLSLFLSPHTSNQQPDFR